MSGIKARLMQPTGLEFFDKAFEIDKEIWNFIKFEYKNKSSAEAGDKRQKMEKTVSNIPSRYWQTHAVPLHQECWRLISKISMANSIYPTNEDELKERRKYQQEAICHNMNILQLLRLTLTEIPSINANKLNTVIGLIKQENTLLRAWKRGSKILNDKQAKPKE